MRSRLFLFFWLSLKVSKILISCKSMRLDERKMEECSNAAKLVSSNEEPKDAKTLDVHENDKVSKQISKDDLLCTACKELLVRPVVLNCGHGNHHLNSQLLEDLSPYNLLIYHCPVFFQCIAKDV